MYDLIVQKLHEIEQIENIKILLAVESGSRAWGFASPDSDYDVRFIYVRPKNEYLKLNKNRDVIELPINDLLDINGWDLDKTLTLLYKSNPTLFEWFSSPIVYLDSEFTVRFKKLMLNYFSTKHSLYHYISMAESNYREYLKRDTVWAKKYFYVLRPVLACQWILDKGTPPPMLFSQLKDAELPDTLFSVVDRLLDIKMNSPEMKYIPRVDVVNDYLDNAIPEIRSRISAMPDDRERSWDELNTLFLQTLEGNAPDTEITDCSLESPEDCFHPDICLEEAIAKLKQREKDIRCYFDIMQMADAPQNSEFQRKYDAFYRVRRNETWRSEYFSIMADFRNRNNPSFGEILLRLHLSTGQIEASFASKMLATLDADMPIWDSNVLKVLNLKLTGKTPELKMSNAVVLYDRICRWYKTFLQTDMAKNWLDLFDRNFPEFYTMSPTKKIDFILWANPIS